VTWKATKLKNLVQGGWEQTCLEYQQIASELGKWTKTKGFKYQDKIYTLKKKGLVPSEEN
jgi:hypothetical protein